MIQPEIGLSKPKGQKLVGIQLNGIAIGKKLLRQPTIPEWLGKLLEPGIFAGRSPGINSEYKQRQNIYPQRPHTKNSLGKPNPVLQWRHHIYTQNVGYSVHLSDTHRIFRRSSTGDLADKALKALKALHISLDCCSATSCYRRTSTSGSLRRSNRGIIKRQERCFGQPKSLRLGAHVEENIGTEADVSLLSSSELASSESSCEQSLTSTSSSPSDFNTNEEIADDVLVVADEDDDEDGCLTNEASSSERMQQESEDDNAPGLHEGDQQHELSSSIQPVTEFEANLAATSKDCRDLFLDYYKRTHADSGNETENHTDPYWKWDKGRHQWFHEDADTQSVVWFTG
ncbi:hypothetical protein F5Y12DRAFT_711762 [Xylaria sp. FL1777]|nr:hypothetical protein F5Y12DRAFT_711762 [Xylaria sp. FL1777]